MADTVYLKYGTWNGTTKTFDYSTEQAIHALEFYYNLRVKRISDQTKRGIDFAHRDFKKKIYTLKISAYDLADTTIMAWIESMFAADCARFSTWTVIAERWTVTDTSVTDFIIPAEDMQKEFIEGCKYLPEVTLELIKKTAET